MSGDWLVVVRKELLDAWRDRRTWTMALLLPLMLTPLMLISVSWIFNRQSTSANPPKVQVVNSDAAPGLAATLRQIPSIEWVSDSTTQTPDLQLVFPERYEQSLMDGQAPSVVLRYDGSKQRGAMAAATIREVLFLVSLQVGRNNLAQAGLDPHMLPVMDVVVQDTAKRGATGALLLSVMLPMMLVVAASSGGLYAAVDTIAGEKERGTFEILLTTPATRGDIALGKFLAVWVAASTSLVSSVAGIYIGVAGSRGLASGPESLVFDLPLRAGVLLTLTGMILAALFTALQLGLSTMARNFKEAQTYLSPLALVPMLMAMVAIAFEPGQAPVVAYYVPGLNAVLVIRELLMQQVSPVHVAYAVLTTGATGLGALMLASRLLRSESILFRA